MSRVVVIGGGIGGLSAARALARAGGEVIVVERGQTLGGLVVDFDISGTPLERFYHHVFPHEHHIRRLIAELGLNDRLEWHPSSVGMFIDGKIWPFTSPLDLLRFRPLAMRDRLRTTIGALRLGRVRDWENLDSITAEDWLETLTGAEARRVVWTPLLRAKFGPAADKVPAAWMWGRFQQRRGARTKGGERLGYMRGGFRALFDALGAELAQLGADVRTDASADRILLTQGRAAGVAVDGEEVEADAVLFTGALPNLPPLLPEDARDERWSSIGGLGVVCVVLELRRPLSSIFWTNVCDEDVPFGGIIEHTNLAPTAQYGGRNIVYLSRYFTSEEGVAHEDVDLVAGRWIEVVRSRFNLAEDDIIGVHSFRAHYAAPLVSTGYLRRIPPRRALPGLYVTTTAQIYPQDRGMSEGVRIGQEVAREILADLDVAQVV